MTSTFLNLLRLALWLNKLSILENILCVPEKIVYCAVVGWMFYVSHSRSHSPKIMFRSFVSLFTSCLVAPVIIESGILKTPSVILELSWSNLCE